MSQLRRIGLVARSAVDRAHTRLRAMIRRMVIAASSDGLWQVLGHEDEGDNDVPIFQGIGFASRPSAASVAAGSAEAIVVKVGGASGHPAIVATRDESIRQEISEGETAIFTSTGATVHIKADGDIELVAKAGGEIRLSAAGGSAGPVVTRTEFVSHKHLDPASGTTSTPIDIITGTTVAKLQ